MERTVFRRSVFIAVLALILCAVSAYSAHAAVISATSDTTWRSSNDPSEYMKVELKERLTKLSVEVKHAESFDGLDLRLIPYTEAKVLDDSGHNWAVISQGRENGASGTLSLDFDYSTVNDKLKEKDNRNLYYLFLYRYDEDDPTGQYMPLVRGPLLQITGGVFNICKYQDIMNSNTALRNSVTSTNPFMVTAMSDLKLLLFHNIYDNNKRDIDAQVESDWYKVVANEHSGGAVSNYDKAKNLFTYVASSYYYDTVHIGGKAGASFDDPYLNTRYEYDRDENSFNAFNGLTALRCDGYAGVYCALVRSQGIPCRLITGKHSEPDPGKNWANQITEHTWCEVYIDGRGWITVDPCLGGEYNKWRGQSNYVLSPHVNYEYFDMTEENLANTHRAEKIRGDYNTVTVAKVGTPKVSRYKTTSNVTVSWTKVKNATNYQVRFKGTKKGAEWKTIATVGNVSSVKVSRQLGYYSVRGYCFRNDRFNSDSGERVDGTWSTAKRYNVTLKKPGRPTAKKASRTKVKISWKKVSGATNYQIASSKYKNKGYKVIKTVGNVSSAKVNGVRKKTRYYKVRAYTFVGNKKYGDNRVNSSYSSYRAFKLK